MRREKRCLFDGNAADFIEAGASHVSVTSYVFHNGCIDYERLEKMKAAVGAKKLVLDLSCKKTEEGYKVVTDRWQKMTEEIVTIELLEKLSDYCDEFLIHAVDVEGKSSGIEEELTKLLGEYKGNQITYAGGVHSFEDLEKLKRLGHDRLNVTIGSSLDLFGGNMEWEKVLAYCKLRTLQPRPYARVSSVESVLMRYFPYSARSLPFCSCSTMRRPMCQYVSIITAFTAP